MHERKQKMVGFDHDPVAAALRGAMRQLDHLRDRWAKRLITGRMRLLPGLLINAFCLCNHAADALRVRPTGVRKHRVHAVQAVAGEFVRLSTQET